jgi:rhodanese-related sulfurtransferase
VKVTHKELIDKALSEIETLEVDDAVALLEKEDTVFVDLRDPRELQREGKIPNAFHATRGMIASSFTVKVDGDRRWPRKLFKIWVWRTSVTSEMAIGAGKTAARRLK